jgi:hypothetical protein
MLHQKNTIRLSMRFSAYRYSSAGDTIQDTDELRRLAGRPRPNVFAAGARWQL